LKKTTWGLKLKSVGQNPAAADAMGVSVSLVRYVAVIIGGILAGVAGASLSIALLNVYQQNLTFGMGFIAVALVYFGGWTPVGMLAGSLLFSLVNAFQLWIQVKGVAISPDFANMLPYILTILALVFAVRKVNQPAALSKPFQRGEG
jgi:simple sugar transport system permease protein